MIDGLHHCPRCSYDLTGERSSRAHRYMHVVLAIALENWPEKHEFRPRNVRHLRAWLSCQDRVDFFDCIAIANPGRTELAEEVITYYGGHMSTVREAGGYAFIVEGILGGFELRVPRSASLAKNGGPDRVRFTAILTRMLDEIIVQTGMDRELLRTRARKDLEPRRLCAMQAA